MKRILDTVSSSLNNSEDKQPNSKDDDLICDYKKIKTDQIDVKRKRKKNTIVFGYLGDGYYGLQRQNGPIQEDDGDEENVKKRTQLYRTIEDDIIKALLDTNSIRYEDSVLMQDMNFQRAARTDKGVSARANFLSLKMMTCDDIVQKLNNNLVKNIRIFDVIPVCRGFDSKRACDHRIYSYLIPTYVLMDASSRDGLIDVNSRFNASSEDKSSLERIYKVLDFYKGVHNFHNFTSGRKFSDRSSNRNILNATISDPFLLTDEKRQITREFCKITIIGQSFMLHQIRKMVSALTYIARGLLNIEWFMQHAYSDMKISIIKAPAEGLYLNQVIYTRYNVRYGNDGIHKSLDLKSIEQKLNDFEQNCIIPNILFQITSNKNELFLEWSAYSLSSPICQIFTDSSDWSSGLRHARSKIFQKQQENDSDLSHHNNADENIL